MTLTGSADTLIRKSKEKYHLKNPRADTKDIINLMLEVDKKVV